MVKEKKIVEDIPEILQDIEKLVENDNPYIDWDPNGLTTVEDMVSQDFIKILPPYLRDITTIPSTISITVYTLGYIEPIVNVLNKWGLIYTILDDPLSKIFWLDDEMNILKHLFTSDGYIPPSKLGIDDGEIIFTRRLYKAIVETDVTKVIDRYRGDPTILREKIWNMANKGISIKYRDTIVFGDLYSKNLLIKKSSDKYILASTIKSENDYETVFRGLIGPKMYVEMDGDLYTTTAEYVYITDLLYKLIYRYIATQSHNRKSSGPLND